MSDDHNRLQSAADKASAINLTQDLSAIQAGLHDEIFQEISLCWWAWMLVKLLLVG